ncbi:hypothetical protein [Ferrovibrio sp.]|uniref:hypothetical protein n=1 Tax=Ferrovibrio sp. TaxID=1917215 RepID=UPI003518A0F1
MATAKLDKGGRLTLPQDLLGSHHWRAGTAFTIEDRPEGLLLRPLLAPAKPARETAAGHGDGGGRDRALAEAMRDRYARLGH